MRRVALEDFRFVPFTGIGYIATFHPSLESTNRQHPPFQFCFPLMIERWSVKKSEDVVLEPQAKFEVSVGYRDWIETYYYANFVFRKEHEAMYDKWRRRFFPDKYLSFLEDYDEVEASVYFITTFDLNKESGEQDFSLIHNFNENFYVLPKDKNENLYVLSKTHGEESILEYIDEAVKVEITKSLNVEPIINNKPHKVLYLNERFQKVFEEKVNKFTEDLGLNKEV